MTLVSCLGGEGNLLAETPAQCRLLELRAARSSRTTSLAKLVAGALADFPVARASRSLFDARRGRPRRGRCERRSWRCARAAERAVDEGVEHPRAQRSRRRRRARGHPEPARDERGAPRAGARGQAHARAGSSSRRARRARCADMALLARLRRGRGEPVPRVRGRSTRSTVGRRRASERGRALRPRARQGAAQGHEQDGHLVPVELPGRADLRGGRDRQGDRSSAGSPGRRRASAASGWPRSRARRCSGTRRGFEADVDGRQRRGRARRGRRLRVARRRRAAPVEPEDGREPAEGGAPRGRASRTSDYARAINEQGDAPFTLRGCWDFGVGEHARRPSTRSSRRRRSCGASPPAR